MEDAETLAYVFSIAKSTAMTAPKFKEYLSKWEAHRKKRVTAVLDYTKLSIKMRAPLSSSILQWIKEWFIVIILKLKGPEGYRWLYGYDATSVEVRRQLEFSSKI